MPTGGAAAAQAGEYDYRRGSTTHHEREGRTLAHSDCVESREGVHLLTLSKQYEQWVYVLGEGCTR